MALDAGNPVASDSKQTQPPVTLCRAAGITTFASDGTTNPSRGGWLMNGVVYTVIGATLYSLSQTGVLTAVGTGIPGSGIVRMSDNGACLVVLVPGMSTAYVYTTASSFGTVALPAAAQDCWFEDTYIVFLQSDGKGFFNDDGSAVSGTGFITFTSGAQFLREFGTDLFVGMGVEHRYITMLGTNTSEIYIDVGAAVGSPFSDAPNNFIEIGCISGFSVVKQDQTLFWAANDRSVRRRNAQTPVRVSNHGIESILATADFTGSWGLAYSYLGHLFYALTLPQAGRTVVLDVTTSEWHELSSFGLGYWRPYWALQAYGKQLVGDSQSGKVGYLDTTAFTEFGSPQTASWTHQAVYGGHKRLSHKRLELILGAGLAPLSTNPKISLFMSDDGGVTFRAAPSRTSGLTGQYQNRMIWTNLGSSRDRVYKFSISDGVTTWVPDVQLEVAPGKF